MVGRTRGRISRAPLQAFFAEGHCEQFWHWQECLLFDVFRLAFLLPTSASPALQGAVKNGFGKAVMVRGVPEPCQFPSLEGCQKRSLWAYKEADLGLHQVVGLVPQVGDADSFPQALGLESLDPFLRVCHPFTPWKTILNTVDNPAPRPCWFVSGQTTVNRIWVKFWVLRLQ